MNMGRVAALAAGFPKTVAATTVNRFCSSGSQAIMMAAHAIINEGAEVAIGAGVETITMMQDGSMNMSRMVNEGAKSGFRAVFSDGCDGRGRRRALQDQPRGSRQVRAREPAALCGRRRSRLHREDIAPMKVTRKVMKKDAEPYDEEVRTVDRDECNRPTTTLEGLAALKPVFKPEEEGGTVTAGNASQLSDGASATLLMSSERAQAARHRTARHLPRQRGRGLWARGNGHRPGVCGAQAAEATRPDDRRHRHRRTQRGLSRRSCSTASANSRSPRRSSIRWGARSRSATPLG